jgi:hypothetical protein
MLNNDETKSKLRLLIELCAELSANAIGSYIFRFVIYSFLHYYFNIKNEPDEFASLIISAVIFSRQPLLMGKIKAVFDI